MLEEKKTDKKAKNNHPQINTTPNNNERVRRVWDR